VSELSKRGTVTSQPLTDDISVKFRESSRRDGIVFTLSTSLHASWRLLRSMRSVLDCQKRGMVFSGF